MWKCPVCETNNDDQKKICPVCGRGQNTAVILEPVESAPRHSSAPDESAARPYEPRHYTSPDDAYASRPSGNAHEKVVHADSADLWKKRRHNNTMIITIIAILAVAAAGIAGWYFSRPKTPLELHVNVENADKIDGVWYIDNSADITWGSNRSKTTYSVSLLGENGDILRYYENTTIDEMNIPHDIIADGNNYTLHIVAAEGKDTAEHEIMLAARIITDDTIITFKDENLAQTIRDTLGIDGYITYGDLQYLTELKVSRGDVCYLDGIQYCTNLTDLYIRFTQVSDISPLAGLSNLTVLYLNTNQISDISPLAGLSGLKRLVLNTNQISDISPLAGLSGLAELILFENQISDISPLAGLSNLTRLNLENNQISDISPLAGLSNLTRLDLKGNLVSDVSPLAGLTNLTWLDLYENPISDISSLAELTVLETLWIERDKIENWGTISPLASYISDLYH